MSRLAALPVLAAKALILVWQWGVSPVLGTNCRYAPSCSAYAWEAIGRHGILRGGWLAVRRIGRCNPWGGAGYDPVPEADHRHGGRACTAHHFEHEARGRRA